VSKGFNGVFMPYAFDKKAKNAAIEFNSILNRYFQI
jgi:hypothetical protein